MSWWQIPLIGIAGFIVLGGIFALVWAMIDIARDLLGFNDEFEP